MLIHQHTKDICTYTALMILLSCFSPHVSLIRDLGNMVTLVTALWASLKQPISTLHELFSLLLHSISYSLVSTNPRLCTAHKLMTGSMYLASSLPFYGEMYRAMCMHVHWCTYTRCICEVFHDLSATLCISPVYDFKAIGRATFIAAVQIVILHKSAFCEFLFLVECKTLPELVETMKLIV